MSSRLVQAVMCFLLLAPAAAVQAAIPQSERDALIAFYAATGGDGWIDNTGWNGASGTECAWSGITCNGAETTVIQLGWSGNQLTGSLPPDLGDLSSLQDLYLDGNQLTGPLPRELGNLTSLRHLSLHSNQLSGSLPTELGNLTSLGILNLNDNQLSGPLPQELGNLTSLTQLLLAFNQFSGSLPQELGNLTSLKFLFVSDNQLTGPLPAELGALPLQLLWANGNQLSGPLPPELAGLTSIGNLALGYNALYAADSGVLGWANTHDPDWETTQTIAPEDMNAPPLSKGDATVSWTPIIFSDLAGGYEIELASSPAGPWRLATTTPSKLESSAIVGGLTSGDWYFRTRTFTESHALNQNTVYSGYGNVASTSVVDGVVVSPTAGLMTTEAGGSDTFTIVLIARPTADVTIGLSSSDTAEGAVAPASVTFTSTNWNVAQTVTVTGVDDGLADGDQPYMIVTGDAVSTTPGYSALPVSEVMVTNIDDETSASESDGDGVDNTVEDGGPNGGDGNDDGTPDSAQVSVATFPAANGNGYITLISTCELRDVVAVLKESLPPTSTLFPYALVEFRLPCTNAEMTVLYHAGDHWSAGTSYWKYGPETPAQELTTKWYELPGVSFDTTTVGGATVARAQFTLTDGQLGDDTGVDGEIVDQGGPGIPAQTASIPTASTWTLLLLASILGTVGFLRLH